MSMRMKLMVVTILAICAALFFAATAISLLNQGLYLGLVVCCAILCFAHALLARQYIRLANQQTNNNSNIEPHDTW